jgi:outer membrane protein assembly factor BamB
MHAISADSGKQVWKTELRGKIRGTAVVAGSRVFVASFAGFVYALDLTSGAKQWEWQSSGPVVSSVALVGERLVVGNRNGILAAIDTATGRPAWRSQLWGSSAESEAVPAGGSTFYFGSSDLRRVAKMDASDGRVFWRTDVLGWAWARPVVADSLLLVSTVGAQPYQMRHLGGLVALDRASGRIVWRYPMPDLPGVWGYGFFAPVGVSDRAIFAAGLDGTLYAFPR